MTQKPHLQPPLSQKPHHFPVDSPCDPHAGKGAVNHLDAVESAAATFLKEIGAVGRGRLDERCEGGERLVGFLGGRTRARVTSGDGRAGETGGGGE